MPEEIRKDTHNNYMRRLSDKQEIAVESKSVEKEKRDKGYNIICHNDWKTKDGKDGKYEKDG